MPARLRLVLESLLTGIVPIDGDVGRRAHRPRKDEPCRRFQAIRPGPRRRVHETAWIPRTILFGPPL